MKLLKFYIFLMLSPIFLKRKNRKKKTTHNLFKKIKSNEINELNEWLYTNKEKKKKYLF